MMHNPRQNTVRSTLTLTEADKLKWLLRYMDHNTATISCLNTMTKSLAILVEIKLQHLCSQEHYSDKCHRL